VTTCRLDFGLEIESKITSVVVWRSRLCCGIKRSTYTRLTGEVTRAAEVPWLFYRFGFVSTTCSVDLLPSILEYRVEVDSAMSSVFNKARLKSQNKKQVWRFFTEFHENNCKSSNHQRQKDQPQWPCFRNKTIIYRKLLSRDLVLRWK